MNDAALFDATVPVFAHCARRAEAILASLPDAREDVLRRRLAPGASSAAEHLDTALGFVARTVYPLRGEPVPETEDRVPDRDVLIASAAGVRALPESLDVADFAGSASRTVGHVAGAAELEQGATTSVTLFALPNRFFHPCMAFAVLRREGIDVGKADFGGQHVYAARGGRRAGSRATRLRPGRVDALADAAQVGAETDAARAADRLAGSCVEWVRHELGLARSAAYRYLEVGHELIRPPVIAARFRRGTLRLVEVLVLLRVASPDHVELADRAPSAAPQIACFRSAS